MQCPKPGIDCRYASKFEENECPLSVCQRSLDDIVECLHVIAGKIDAVNSRNQRPVLARDEFMKDSGE